VATDLDGAAASQAAAAAVAAEGQASAEQLDVRDADQVDALVRRVAAEAGLHVLVNNAGVLTMGEALELEAEDWERTFAVNVMGLMNVARAGARVMVDAGHGGRIINLSSVAAKVGLRDQADYSASKAAVLNLSRTLAKEWSPHGIGVVAVCPGAVDTQLFRDCLRWSAQKEGVAEEALLAQWLKESLIGRLIRPGEVASLIAYLASPAAEAIVGCSLNIDGGVSPF
jgi:NAD(P)-dependent dehydrogenase (short-subunit alcohol dehydrogenase family)